MAWSNRFGIARRFLGNALFVRFFGLDHRYRAWVRDCCVVTENNRISARSARWVAAALCATAYLGAVGAHPAAGQGKLEAQYEASLAGIPVGRGAWNVEIGDDSYAAAASGGTTGILKTLANGSGTGAAQGRVVNGALVPQAYQASNTTSKKAETIHITLANGNIKEFGIDPVPPVDADRIPVTEAHKKGVFDPMTASLLRVPGTGDPLGPEACRTGAAVFDGRMRYDLKLDFKRMETVKADK